MGGLKPYSAYQGFWGAVVGRGASLVGWAPPTEI